MRALYVLAGFLAGAGCAPAVAQPVASSALVAAPEPRPMMRCHFMVKTVTGGVAILEGPPAEVDVHALQAGGVEFEVNESRRMRCKRLDDDDEAPRPQTPTPRDPDPDHEPI